MILFAKYYLSMHFLSNLLKNYLRCQTYCEYCISIYEKYIYNEFKTDSESRRFRCKNRSCKGFVKIKNGSIIEKRDHMHSEVPSEVEKL